MTTTPDRSKPPVVSILTPAYNAAPYIEETLDSILGQTFADFEALVVDDGSTDATAAIVEAFQARDPRIRLIRHAANRGISAARNTAMSQARGTFFALLDSDDVWFPGYLATMLDVLHASPDTDVVSANAINLGGAFDGRPWKPAAPTWSPLSLRDLIEVEDSVCILSVFRRSVFETIGGFDSSLRGSEDYDYWLRAAAARCAIRFVGTPLGRYRRRDASVSADEALMLSTIQIPLRKLRDTLADGSPELAAIDGKLELFEQRRLTVCAKRALLAGDFDTTSTSLSRLAERTGRLRHRAMAFVARTSPALLLWAYSRTGRGWRPGPAQLDSRRA